MHFMKKYTIIIFAFTLLTLSGFGCVTIGHKAGVGDGGVFESRDKGKTWVQVNVSPTAQGLGSIANMLL